MLWRPWTPWTRRRWEWFPPDLREKYPELRWPTAEEAILMSVNFLISQLYKPDPEHGCVVDREKLRRLEEEYGDLGVVNWGDLSCVDVEDRDGVYLVTIEEASADGRGLCQYLETWLHRWGWNVVVRTEW